MDMDAKEKRKHLNDYSAAHRDLQLTEAAIRARRGASQDVRFTALRAAKSSRRSERGRRFRPVIKEKRHEDHT